MPDYCVGQSFKAGDSFGEKSVLERKPRQETVNASEDCLFAIVGREMYTKILNKLIDSQNRAMASFLRQIPFMSEWMHRELLQFSKAMQTKNYMVPGSQVFEEGKELTHVAIVKEGEFLVAKRSLDRVYMNQNTG